MSWSKMKQYVDAMSKAASNMPAPPTPDDAWSEKCNTLNKTLEGMREQLEGRMQYEEQ